MYAVVLALAIASATPTILDSTAFIESMDAKWVTFTDVSVQTLSRKQASLRFKMTRRNYCHRRGISDVAECTDIWSHISLSDEIAPNEIEIIDDEGYRTRFSQENYCAFWFKPRPYTSKMCDALWSATIKQAPTRKKAAD